MGYDILLGEKDTRYTTNISESMNSTLKESRELHVIGLVESIRSLVKNWFYELRTKWKFQHTKLSVYAEDIIRESLRESRSTNVSCLTLEQ